MARPLVDLFCIEREGCKYPVAVRILMDDSTVQTYTLDSSVSPVVQKASDILKESISISIGYQHMPMKRKRRNRIYHCNDKHGSR